MVTEFDLLCTNCGGEIAPVKVPVDGEPGIGSGMRRLGECVDCGARHYPEQALEDSPE